MKDLEKNFTATDYKLLQHPDRLLEIKKGIFKPITLELAPTNKCNLDCVFCSVKNRDKTQEIPFEELVPVLEQFRDLGLKNVEITGGGEPTLYPQINELIEWIYWNTKWPIGLITNGTTLEELEGIIPRNLDRLEWLRISLNSLDYVDKIFIPKIQGTLGFSYVWNEKSTEETLDKIHRLKIKHNAEYVRVVPNCLSVKDQQEFKKRTAVLVKQYPGFFAQSKPYSVPKRCWWGYLKPFLNADGYIYRCSACALLERRFPEAFRMGHMSQVKKIWDMPVAFDSKSKCQEGKCFFASQNEIIENMLKGVEHDAFI